ncbi:hypothetical protein [Cylindrospermum sp. FACHB-282]|uniref:hypothetical protein n=1 Tax=Cylindrospermum sp. FACHB-282 TaxID=2692794 RepID=UPI00168386B1|nr:hypothetical protein [Cylindrospermum sp. FACHB-282]MBD2385996.1 hypothetical protein [Cylindrospermum sp. FACHB-282]
MIENRTQYLVTKQQLESLRFRLENNQPGTNLHPLLQKAITDGLQSQIKTLSDEIIEYESVISEEPEGVCDACGETVPEKNLTEFNGAPVVSPCICDRCIQNYSGR